MKISIIIPVYNVEQYVVQCLQSVADQTWKDGEIECIVVDDCGTDRSMALVEEFISSYSGRIDFKVVRHEKNRGISAARNSGVDASNGDYLYFLDSDDTISIHCFRLLVDRILCYPGVELVHGRIVSIPYKDYYDRKALDSIDYLGDNLSIRKCFFDLSINAFDKLILTSYYKLNRLIFKEGIIHEDELWAYYLYGSLCRIAFVHEATYYHKIRPGSIMTTLDPRIERDSWSDILLELSQIILDPCSSSLERYYLLKFIYHFDGDKIWDPISTNFIRSMKKSHDLISLNIFKHSLERKGQFYINWFRYITEKEPAIRLYYIIGHMIKFCITSR